MSSATDIQKELSALGSATIAEHSQRFFKTGPGEYGAGDLFRGIRVPAQRQVARRHRTAALRSVLALLRSAYHEDRLTALLILVLQFERGEAAQRQRIYDAYLHHTGHINNWDLVDSSAHQIVGGHLVNRGRHPLRDLAVSPSLWERRIAIIATLHFIKLDDFSDTFEVADLLLEDTEDLIHKAVGWMLREAGNRDHAAEERYLLPRYRRMPRTMLRYAIEKFPEARRQEFLRGTA
jgi:3-methyladenine DNA glycosylase AlkD